MPRVKSSSKICGTPAASTNEPKICSSVSSRLIVSSESYAELNQAKLSQAQKIAKNDTANHTRPCAGMPRGDLVLKRQRRLGDRDDVAKIGEQLERRRGAVLLMRITRSQRTDQTVDHRPILAGSTFATSSVARVDRVECLPCLGIARLEQPVERSERGLAWPPSSRSITDIGTWSTSTIEAASLRVGGALAQERRRVPTTSPRSCSADHARRRRRWPLQYWRTRPETMNENRSVHGTHPHDDLALAVRLDLALVGDRLDLLGVDVQASWTPGGAQSTTTSRGCWHERRAVERDLVAPGRVPEPASGTATARPHCR